MIAPDFDAANYRHRHFRRVCRAARQLGLRLLTSASSSAEA